MNCEELQLADDFFFWLSSSCSFKINNYKEKNNVVLLQSGVLLSAIVADEYIAVWFPLFVLWWLLALIIGYFV